VNVIPEVEGKTVWIVTTHKLYVGDEAIQKLEEIMQEQQQQEEEEEEK